MSNFHKVFEWLNGVAVEITFSDEEAASGELDRIMADEVLKNTQIKTESLEPNRFIEFLNCCRNNTSIYKSAIQYLLQQPSSSRADEIRKEFKLRNLLKKLKSTDCNSFNQLTHDDLNKLKRFPNLSALFDSPTELPVAAFTVDGIRNELDGIRQELKGFKKYEYILPLIGHYIDKPQRFTALILWILKNGATAEIIINSTILHQYYEYHLPSHDKQSSPIRGLYDSLMHFSRAKKLLELCAETSCVLEKGNQTYQNYNLQGIHVEQKKPSRINSTSYKFRQPLTIQQFQTLYRLFGFTFLTQALILFKEEQKQELKEILSLWFSGRESNITFQSGLEESKQFLLNVLHSQHKRLLELVMPWLPLEKILTLLIKDEDDTTLLHLLEYSPELLKLIPAEEILLRLEKVIVMQHQTDFWLESICTKMFSHYLGSDDLASAGRVFIFIFEHLLKNTHIDREDIFNEIVPHYREVYFIEETINVRREEIKKSFLEKMELCAATNLTSESYRLLEDSIIELNEQINVFKEFYKRLAEEDEESDQSGYSSDTSESDEPNEDDVAMRVALNRFIIRADIVERQLKADPETFSLLKLLQQFESNPGASFDELTDYEKTLQEILIRINDEHVAHEALSVLVSLNNSSVNDRTCHVLYKGKRELFLQLMEKKTVIPSQELTQTIMNDLIAQKDHQCIHRLLKVIPESEIDYLLQLLVVTEEDQLAKVMEMFKHDINVHHINYLLKDALQDNDLQRFVNVSITAELEADKQILESGFAALVEQGDNELIGEFLEKPKNRPASDCVRLAIYCSLNDRSWSTACYVWSKFPELVIDSVIIDECFSYLLRNKLWSELQMLLSKQLPSFEIMKELINEVVSQERDDLIGYLYIFHKVRPIPCFSQLIQSGLVHAAKEGKPNIICSILKSNLCQESPMALNVDQALLIATHHHQWNVVKSLLVQKPPYCPSPKVLVSTFQKAIDQGRVDVTTIIRNLEVPLSYARLKQSKDKLANAISILSDYTKNNSSVSRFFHGHWNRHHVREVDSLLMRISIYQDRQKVISEEKLFKWLDAIPLKNPCGSLARRIQYIKLNIYDCDETSLEAQSPLSDFYR